LKYENDKNTTSKLSINDIRRVYNEELYPEAEKILFTKFKVQFKTPNIKTILSTTIKASNTITPPEQQPSNTTSSQSNTKSFAQVVQNTPDLNNNTAPPLTSLDPSSQMEDDDDVIMGESNDLPLEEKPLPTHTTTLSFNPFC
jgi:hypothetical protein